jgi:hypothetical protein
MGTHLVTADDKISKCIFYLLQGTVWYSHFKWKVCVNFPKISRKSFAFYCIF